jgi:hypothetical protein
MLQQKFEAVLIRPDEPGSWTYLVIPFDVEVVFGNKKVPVRGLINGHPYRSSAMRLSDGTYYIVVSKAIRDAIGAEKGDTVQVAMEIDPEERSVAVPDDLNTALDANGDARVRFDKMSYSHQKEYVEWIESAKKDETRQRRIASAIEKIIEGTRLKS